MWSHSQVTTKWLGYKARVYGESGSLTKRACPTLSLLILFENSTFMPAALMFCFKCQPTCKVSTVIH